MNWKWVFVLIGFVIWWIGGWLTSEATNNRSAAVSLLWFIYWPYRCVRYLRRSPLPKMTVLH